MINKEDVTQIINRRIFEAEQEILKQADCPDVICQMHSIIWELNKIKDEVGEIRDEPDFLDPEEYIDFEERE